MLKLNVAAAENEIKLCFESLSVDVELRGALVK
jgi:hypothetical protein